MKAIDSSAKTTGQANNLAAAGYGAVGVYLRPDRCTAAMIAELHTAGLKVWSIYEKGHPDSNAYFTAAQGTSDGNAAAAFATSMGQPNGGQIYAAVDYDPDGSNPAGPTINGRISDYMKAFQAAIKPAGYVASVYGSGRTCRILMANGLAKTGWLTQSTGFAEYTTFKPKAGIVQLPAINNDWDGDDIPDPTVVGLWQDEISDSRSYSKINDRMLEMTVKKNGKIIATGRIVVSADGKRRILTLSGISAKGKSFVNTYLYYKQ